MIALGACACAGPADDIVAPVTVVPTPVETAVTMICDQEATWVAFQNDASPWTRAVGTAGVFGVHIATRGGIAMMYAVEGKWREIRVVYGTASELALQFSKCPAAYAFPMKSMTGAVAGVAAGTSAVVSLGDTRAVFSSSTDYTLPYVADGPRDVVAYTTRDNVTWPTRLIIRRALNLVAGARIPLLDFEGAEATSLSAATLTITGIGGARAFLRSTFSTATSPLIFLAGMEAAPVQAIYGVPTALTQPGDYHDVIVAVTSTDETRMAFTRFRDVADRTIALGPSLSVPSTSVVATAPYVRPRTRLPSQADYADVVIATWNQVPATGAWIVASVALSRDYLGARSDTWEATMPDLTTAGFSPTWGFQRAVPIATSVDALGGTSLVQFFRERPANEFNVRYAGRVGAPTSLSAFPTSPGVTSDAQRLMHDVGCGRHLATSLAPEGAPDGRIFLADAPERDSLHTRLGCLTLQRGEQLGVGDPDFPFTGLHGAQRVRSRVALERYA